MFILNRREVFIGNLENYNKVKIKLDNRGIKYTTKCEASSSITNGRTEFTGRIERNNNIYYIFVHKKDFDNAKNCLNDQI